MNQTVGKERVRIAGVMERVLGLAVVNNVNTMAFKCASTESKQ